MDNNDWSTTNAALKLVWEDVSSSAKSAYTAFSTEVQNGGDTRNFQVDYTKNAAASNLPDVDVIDPKNPPKLDKPGTYHEVMDVNGVPRSYTIHVPEGYDGSKAMPVMVLLHGHGEDGQDIANRSGIDQEADKKGFIAVYPDAVQWFGDKSLSAWDSGDGLVPPGSNADDVGFINSIIDSTGKQLNVDNKRVYLAGFSNGGMLAADVASQIPDKIAGVAMISSGVGDNYTAPNESIPLVSIHGTSDPVIPIGGYPDIPKGLNYLGIPSFQSYDDSIRQWVKADGITTAPTVTTNGGITERDYKNSGTGAEVAQYTVSGGTHDWYGSSGDSGANASINATDVAWDFLSTKSK